MTWASWDGLHAFGGGPLCGDKWVRTLYLDETGTGKVEHEPYLIMAGVIINVDKQYMAIKEYMRSLLEGATPEGQPIPKCLHAVDIYHGYGEFPKAAWPEDIRYELLDEVAKVPVKFKTPIVWSLIDRRDHAHRNPSDTRLQQLIDCYATVTTACLLQAEWYMREEVGEREVASITIEQATELQKRVKEVFRKATSPEIIDEIYVISKQEAEHLLPLKRIIDEPAFQEKTSSSILQLADYCAFAYKRAASRQQNFERLAKPLSPASIILTDNTGSRFRAPSFGQMMARFRIVSGEQPS